MTLEEYQRARQRLSVTLLASLVYVMTAGLIPGISLQQWRRLINVIYPRVKAARDDATELARQFFDSERERETGSSRRVDFFKSDNYPIEWFEDALEPVFEYLQNTAEAETADAVVMLSNRLTKVVEDGGRRTLLDGVDQDEEALGWARFDPRPPTCSFCTILISRGPVYKSARTAGSPLGNKSVIQLLTDGGDDAFDQMKNRFHPGDTCIVVPVYRYQGYPTEDQEEAALKVYQAGRKKAKSNSAKDILAAMRTLTDEDQHKLPS